MLKISGLLTKFVENAVENAVDAAVEDAVENAISEREIEFAKKLLKRGMSIMAISEDTGLDESTITRIQSELSNE